VELNRICVFCGSSTGRDPAYVEAAQTLGRIAARQKIGIVFGGGSVGLMNALADAALEQGGEVIGVITHALAELDVDHQGLTEMRRVSTMHERKALMAELSDAFIALPGGIGTLEELFEALTWTQLGIHEKPCGLLNAADYYTPLLGFLDGAVDQGFLHPGHRSMLVIDTEPQVLMEKMLAWNPPRVKEWWIDRKSS